MRRTRCTGNGPTRSTTPSDWRCEPPRSNAIGAVCHSDGPIGAVGHSTKYLLALRATALGVGRLGASPSRRFPRRRWGEAGLADIIGRLGNFSMLAMLLNTCQVDLKPGDPPPFPDVRGSAKVNSAEGQ
jgi:hypothetical protein